jgi:hypothetical protein
MDKLTQHSQIVQALLAEYAAIPTRLTPSVQTQLLADTQHHHYQLLRIGWHDRRFVHTIMFHFDLVGDKIWIQQNNTDVLIADELIEHGVSRSDIVLGFLSEAARPHSGFATT